MDEVALLAQGFADALAGWNLLYCLIGVSVGMFVGVMPGLGPVAGTAMLIPLTFGMPAVSAIIMLSGIYYGAMYGGTITSVLINTPGEAASVITCVDGHQMAKQGRAGVALGIAAIGSFVGGTAAIVGLTFLAPVLAKFALRFGPPEFFSLMILSLSLLVGLMGKSILRGLIAAVFGFMLALMGTDNVSGEVRYAFGVMHLLNGVDLVAVVMGLFGISEILISAEEETIRPKPASVGKLLPERAEWKQTIMAINRGTIIGFLIGLLPGANTVVSSLIAYSTEKKVAKDPSRFGQGALEGVAGPETANNATAGAAIIPLFTLGIPSSPTIAILFGAFMLHGLTPGPMLFQDNPDFVWAVIASFYIGNIVLLLINLPMAKLWAKIILVPYKLLYPFILIFCIIGAYSVNNQVWDIGVMLLFGVIGYLMKKMDIPMTASVLTFVLGRQIESALVQSLIISQGSWLIFLQRPVSAILMGLIAIILLVAIYSSVKNKRDMLAGDLEV